MQTTTLDNLISQKKWDYIDFLKIDAEGHDLQIIKGVELHLAQHKIGVIQFEYGIEWIKTSSTLYYAYKFLEKYGYKVFILQNTGLSELDYKLFGEFFSYSNFVAVSNDIIQNNKYNFFNLLDK